MGQYASEPVVKKDTELHESEKIYVGASSMQGWRINMEDYRACHMKTPEDSSVSFFAVFDGHGGHKTAEYSSKTLASRIIQRPEYKQGKIEEAIKNGYLELDKELRTSDSLKNDKSGTTALSLLVKDDTFYCGNVGDSRGILCQRGMAIALSRDHKPSDPIELERIEDSGNFVSFDRVNGILAMSRALGDFSFKETANLVPEKQALSPVPDIKVMKITPDFDFVLLASDGIWDVMSNQQAANFVIDQAKKFKPPDEICESMLDQCLAPDTSSPLSACGLDNMTTILIVFLPQNTSPSSVPSDQKSSVEIRNETINIGNSTISVKSSDRSAITKNPLWPVYKSWCQKVAAYQHQRPLPNPTSSLSPVVSKTAQNISTLPMSPETSTDSSTAASEQTTQDFSVIRETTDSETISSLDNNPTKSSEKLTAVELINSSSIPPTTESSRKTEL